MVERRRRATRTAALGVANKQGLTRKRDDATESGRSEPDTSTRMRVGI